MASQDVIRLGINPYIKAGQGNLVGGKESHKQAKESKTPQLPLLKVKQKPQAKKTTMYLQRT